MKAILCIIVMVTISVCVSGFNHRTEQEFMDYRTLKNILSKPRILDREKTADELYFLRYLRQTMSADLTKRYRNLIYNEADKPVLGFSYSNCGSPSDPVKIQSINISPDPLRLPGKISVSAKVEVDEVVGNTTSAVLVLQKKILFWITVPCIDNIGSCTYNDVCSMDPFKTATCPPIFSKNHIPCKCPIKKGSYNLPLTSFDVTAKAPGGDYKAQVTLMNGSQRLACIAMELTIA